MKSCSKLPVTSLKILNDLLLTGQGSELIIYSLRTYEKIYSLKIFKSSQIHKLYVDSKNNNNLLIIVGGKSARCMQISSFDENISISFKSKEKIFKAWIWDVVWFSENTILMISAHNTVLSWDILCNVQQLISSCTQQCILYSATFSTIAEETVVAAGTVFNRVLLWKPTLVGCNVEHSFVPVWKTFIGHEGVIFGIRFHPTNLQLLSVSDDRSIRLWSIHDETCLKVLYGHTARVWDARYLNDNIVSIGEDSVCVVWNSDGQIVKKYGGHKGKSIWSLDVSESMIVTGGGDGSIRCWTVADEHIISGGPSLEFVLPSQAEDFPRTVKILDENNIAVFTNEGILWNYNVLSQTWEKIFVDQRFHSYCCIDILEDIVALGNLGGILKLFLRENPVIHFEEQILQGKIYSLMLLPHGVDIFLLLTGTDGEIKLLRVNKTPTSISVNVEALFILPHSRQRWVSAATIIINESPDPECKFVDCNGHIFLICGDKRGSLHFYRSGTRAPIQSILGVHGKTGVTKVVSNHGFVYTTGRDGTYQKYMIDSCERCIKLVDKQKACKGMEWIEGICFNAPDVILYGFYMQSYFAAWSNQSNELLFKVKCGGGYRSWDVLFPRNNDWLRFTYLKGALINSISCKWNINSHGKIIQEPLHGREVMCLKVLGHILIEQIVCWLIATCSEDTTINFSLYNSDSQSLKNIHSATGHIGGIKDIYFLPTATQDQTSINGLFISCGSRTSLKFWCVRCDVLSPLSTTHARILLQHDGENYISSKNYCNGNLQNTFACSLTAEIYNPETTMKKLKLKNNNLIDDMRYLSCSAFMLSDVCPDDDVQEVVCCVCACSDGVARLYTFHHGKVELLITLDFHKHCVQIAKHHINVHQCTVFTSATDGRIAVWQLTSKLRQYASNFGKNNLNDADVDTKDTSTSNTVKHVNRDKYKFHDINVPLFSLYQPNCSVKLHQSGVNTLDVKQTSSGFILVSGGDDNALHLCQINYTLCEVESILSNIGAHISSISAVRFINNNMFASTSIDQRIKFWKYTTSEIILVHEILSDVADVSNMEIWKDRTGINVAVTGIGIEIFKIDYDEMTSWNE